jgi:glucan 1,3-beta-glucosidase
MNLPMLLSILFLFCNAAFISSKQTFAGVTYNPFRLDRTCQTAANIDEDLKIISQFSRKIRTYGANCAQEIHILKAAKKYNISVTLGLWVDEYPATWSGQFGELKQLAKNATAEELSYLSAVVVGNEAIFRGEQNSSQIIEKIEEVRCFLKASNLSHVQLTTSDIPQYYDENPDLFAAVDFALPNIHVFFDNFTVDVAPNMLFQKFDLLSSLTSKKIVIGETGWPSDGASWNGSVSYPSPAAASFFLNRFICEANRRGLDYFYFDAFNADWKKPNSTDQEYHWGIMSADRSSVKEYVQDALHCTDESFNFSKVPVCNGAVFDDLIYSCTDSIILCSRPLVGCGSASYFTCYDPALFQCVNGSLEPFIDMLYS